MLMCRLRQRLLQTAFVILPPALKVNKPSPTPCYMMHHSTSCMCVHSTAPPPNLQPPTPPSLPSPTTTSQQVSSDSTASTNPVAPSAEVPPLDSPPLVESYIAPGNAALPAVSIALVCVVMATIIWYCRRRGVIGARQRLVSPAHKRPSIG